MYVIGEINFVGESAVDLGGPKREYFRLFAMEAKEHLLQGPPTRKFFSIDLSAVKVCNLNTI